MTDRAPFDAFVAAQDAVWPDVLAELEAGRKQSHWIWFVFPQLGALGRSGTAKRFGLADLDDARAYFAHPVLGPRLLTTTRLMLAHRGADPVAVLGSIDALKFRSSMTLFESATGDPAFSAALDAFFAGARCPLTLDLTSNAKL